jgi:octanoyl-[GcvH]:protein N-octanoyltransferase
MASLTELLGVQLSVQDVMLRFLHVLKEHSGRIFSDTLSVQEWPLYEAYLTRVVERNDKVFDSIKD